MVGRRVDEGVVSDAMRSMRCDAHHINGLGVGEKPKLTEPMDWGS